MQSNEAFGKLNNYTNALDFFSNEGLVPAALTQAHSHRSLFEKGHEIQLCLFCLDARKYYPSN